MTAATATEAVRTTTAADIAGVSFRQIDYWVRNRVITPTVPEPAAGTVRMFSLADVIVIARLAVLSELLGGASGGPPLTKLLRLAHNGLSVVYNDVTVRLAVDLSAVDAAVRERWPS